MNDIEIRAHAAQAAATCAQSIGYTDAIGYLRICTMIEAYIRTGEDAAMTVLNGWSGPEQPQAAAQPPAPSAPAADPQREQGRAVQAQNLATAASQTTDLDTLQEIIDTTKREELSTQKVKVGNITGPLGTYLNNQWYLLTTSTKTTSVPLNERNKSTRADLGL